MKLTVESKIHSMSDNMIGFEMALNTGKKQFIKTAFCPKDLYDDYENVMLENLFLDMKLLIEKHNKEEGKTL